MAPATDNPRVTPSAAPPAAAHAILTRVSHVVRTATVRDDHLTEEELIAHVTGTH